MHNTAYYIMCVYTLHMYMYMYFVLTVMGILYTLYIVTQVHMHSQKDACAVLWVGQDTSLAVEMAENGSNTHVVSRAIILYNSMAHSILLGTDLISGPF